VRAAPNTGLASARSLAEAFFDLRDQGGEAGREPPSGQRSLISSHASGKSLPRVQTSRSRPVDPLASAGNDPHKSAVSGNRPPTTQIEDPKLAIGTYWLQGHISRMKALGK
jgi:hypothetical protein